MRGSVRAVFCAVVLFGTTGWFASCTSGGDDSGGQDPPSPVNDVLEVTGAGLASIAVLANDQDLDNEPLTYRIEEDATVGSASFNADGTVRLDLPSGFQGVTRFRYRITNSLGGFATATAVVFVDVPAYRVLFAAGSNSRPDELYVSDLTSPVQLSRATNGALRLINAWKSENGGLVVYERANPASVSTTRELFYVRTSPVGDPVRIRQPLARTFDTTAPVAVSDDNRWVAFVTAPTSTGGQPANIHVFDTTTSADPVAVGFSANVLGQTLDWVGDQLFFMAAPAGTIGTAVYRASPGAFDAPQRVSPFYASGNANRELLVSPDGTRLILAGVRGGVDGVFAVDTASPNEERRLTIDMPAGALVQSFELTDDYTSLTYLWRVPNSANARLSTVPVSTTSVELPTVVIEADLINFTELRPDGAAALVTRGPGGPGTDGVVFEVALDNSTADVRVAANVSGGIYDGTGDRVYLFSRTLAPSVIERSDFNRGPDVLVRSTTPALALFIAPLLAPSAAIIQDPTSGLVLVNAAAPGDTFRLSDLTVTSNIPGLLPDAID